MPTTTTRADPAQLRTRFKQATRMPAMLEVRDHVRVAIRQTSDAMDEEGGDSNAELNALFAQLKALLDEIDQRITRRATIDDLERRAQGAPLRDGTERDFQLRCCQFSLFRSAAAAIGLPGVDDALERDVSAELVRRSKGRSFTGNCIWPLEALSVQAHHLSSQRLAKLERRDTIGTNLPADGPGGALFGTYTDPQQYIDVLRPAMAVRQAGARVLTGLTSNLRIPRMTRSGKPGWFAENTAIPQTDEAFDNVDLAPHHDGAIVEVTRNALQQANPDVEAIVRNDLALKLANDVDITAIGGTGVAPMPLGIVRDPLVPTQPEAALTYDNIVDLIGSLAAHNALNGSLGFIGDATVMVQSMKLKDNMGRPYGDLLWHGWSQYWTNLAAFEAAPEAPIVFGNWADLIVAFWSELDVLVNPYETSAYSKGNVMIRAAMTLDIQKRHPESFIWMNVTAPEPANGRATQHPTRAAPRV